MGFNWVSAKPIVQSDSLEEASALKLTRRCCFVIRNSISLDEDYSITIGLCQAAHEVLHGSCKVRGPKPNWTKLHIFRHLPCH